MKKQVINHRLSTNRIINLNGEMIENVANKIGAECYVYKEAQYLTFICEAKGGRRFTTNKVGEMYAYLCGILLF